jgi:hypothetical protein
MLSWTLKPAISLEVELGSSDFAITGGAFWSRGRQNTRDTELEVGTRKPSARSEISAAPLYLTRSLECY